MKKLLIICTIGLIPIFMFAARVGVLHFKAVGVATETAEAVVALLASDLANYKHQVMSPDAIDAAVGQIVRCYESSCAAEIGFTAKVERVIYGSVSKLGDKHIVQASVVNVSTREVVWSGSLSAISADDLDMVAKRLAKSIAEGKKAEETIEVGMVTEQEEEAPRRRHAFFVTGGKFGMLFPLGGYGGSGNLVYGAFSLWYEIPNMAVELSYDFGFSGNLVEFGGQGKALEHIIDMSFMYLFSKNDFCPYVKGGIGMSSLGLYDSLGYSPGDMGMAFGLGTSAGAGLLMFRTYDFRVLIETTYHINFNEIPGFEGPHHGPKIMLGLLYRPRRRKGCGGGCFSGGCW